MLAYDNGTFGLIERNSFAITVWWTVGLATALGLARFPRSRSFWASTALLAAFGGWTAASVTWAASAERAFNEFNRVALYLGVFAAAALVGPRARGSRWTNGLALGVAAVALVALAQRFFPEWLPAGDITQYSRGPELSYPIEYANGLAILLALGFPPLLRAAVDPGPLLWRGVAAGAVPAVACAIYLTSARGAVVVVAVAVIGFTLLSTRRWASVGVLVLGVAATAVAVALINRTALVDQPFSQAAEDQGPRTALLVGLVCVLTGLVYVAGVRLVGPRRPVPPVGWLATAAVLALVIAGFAAADPVERFRSFRQPPAASQSEQPARGQLLSANGSGRWQFWKAAGQQFRAHPIKGGGAGSYAEWWLQRGSIAIFVTEAHSLYLEALGELGAIGLLLLLAALGVAVAGLLHQTLRAPESERSARAALAACAVAYLTGAAVDWVWEITAVSFVGLLALGLGVADPPARATERAGRHFVVRAAAVGLASALVVCQVIPLLAAVRIRDSQAAIRAGELGSAVSAASAARDIQAWAASPHLQVALVEEERGRLTGARASIREAIERHPADWRLWLIKSRLETKMGRISDALRSLGRAKTLNPRSPLFASAVQSPPS